MEELNDFLAFAMSNLSKFNDAIMIYDWSLQINPNNSYNSNNKGRYLDIFYSEAELLHLGNLNEAIIWFDRALEINNNHPAAYTNEGVI